MSVTIPSSVKTTGDNNNNDNPGNDHNGKQPENNSGNTSGKNNSEEIKAVVETWKPKTPDEIRRYVCMGKEAVWYVLPKDNVYQIDIENAMQGPMCFQSFEAVLGDYTIGRTYNTKAEQITYIVKSAKSLN